ncbi:MAG: TetR/AcrR family transcriptional regulator [Deltaproteobacteria bacterium]|nr:TetR/AcrR family transcriptional regulator [Deltaproteobacteria bacterium]
MAQVINASIGPPAGRSLRSRPTDRRGEIIAAAIQVIARDGIRACTVSALERETRFARGHFTYHFKAKEEIIGLAFATVASDWARTQMEATFGDTACARLEQRVRAAVHWAQVRPDYFRCLMNFRVEIMRNPSAFPPSAAIRRQLWEFAAQMIHEGIAEGSFRSAADPSVEARTVFAIVDGLLMHAAMDPTFCPADELADRAWEAVANRLGTVTGVRVDGGQRM